MKHCPPRRLSWSSNQDLAGRCFSSSAVISSSICPGFGYSPVARSKPTDAGEGELEQARHGAVRELEEESGIVLSPSALQPFSYWLTPTVVKRRFSTWFFLAEVSSDTVVTVDGSEIVEYQWWPAARAIDAHQTGELPMTPPTLVSLYDIHNWQGSDVLPADAVSSTPPVFFPRVVREGDTMTFLYEGDVAYDTGDLALTGPQIAQRVRGIFLPAFDKCVTKPLNRLSRSLLKPFAAGQ